MRFALASWGPRGLWAEYRARVARRLAGLPPATPVSAAELAPLPAAVQRYLRLVGVVGRDHLRGFRARFKGRIRNGPEAPWMPFEGEQHNFVDPPARFFFMRARMFGLPVVGLHAYEDQAASMRVKLLSLLSVAHAEGPAFTRTETVTLLNDLCIMAPAGLLDPSIGWRELDPGRVEAAFREGPHSVRAVLEFADSGELVNFWSDDRPALAADGVTFVPQRWSTPVGSYAQQGAFFLASRGEGRYAAAQGEYAYIQFEELKVSHDLGAP